MGVLRLLDRLNDVLCFFGLHQWWAGAREGTRFCANCGELQQLEEWSVIVQGARWERLS